MVLIQAQIEAELAREQALQSEQDAKEFEDRKGVVSREWGVEEKTTFSPTPYSRLPTHCLLEQRH